MEALLQKCELKSDITFLVRRRETHSCGLKTWILRITPYSQIRLIKNQWSQRYINYVMLCYVMLKNSNQFLQKHSKKGLSVDFCSNCITTRLNCHILNNFESAQRSSEHLRTFSATFVKRRKIVGNPGLDKTGISTACSRCM